jgi:alkanesulfonate monooxygenase SsuD/methylene tetrahydromethanopterin reductase-like flavin-dependent oxidoreductase (luciferase family)
VHAARCTRHPREAASLGASALTAPHGELDVGLVVPTIAPFDGGLIDLGTFCANAESSGFDSVWVGDHLAFHAPMLDSVVAASIAVARTSTIEVGFGVLLAALRHPAWLAKHVSSLQAVSGDRVALGIGVGGENPAEWRAVGVSPTERGARTDALLAQLGPLLSGQPVSLGPPWGTDVPPLLPHGAVPPLWFGGRSERALRRAVEHRGGWLALWADEARLTRSLASLAEWAERAHLTCPAVGLQVVTNLQDSESGARREAAEYMTAIYDIPFERVARWVVAGNEALLVDRIAALVATGLQMVVFVLAGPRPDAMLPRLAEVARQLKADATGSGLRR